MSKYLFIPCIFFINLNCLLAQSSLHQQAVDLMQSRRYAKAEPVLRQILKQNNADTYALYELANSLYQQQQIDKKRERINFKFKNFQPYFDQLNEAYSLAGQATLAYQSLSPDGKLKLRRDASISEGDIQQHFQNTILQELYNLIKFAPYRKKTSILYGSGIYNQVEDAEELVPLREALYAQCGDFLNRYPKSRFFRDVTEFRKGLLSEYTNIAELRQYGDKSGVDYEKYCKQILELYSPEELRHIVPQFYSREYGFREARYQQNPNYQSLKELADRRGETVIAYLCEINIHYEGYTEAKVDLYDQFIRYFAPMDIAYIAVQKKAAFYADQNNWEKAAKVYGFYQPFFPDQQTLFDKTIRMLRAPEQKRQLVNLGQGVNHKGADYNPVMTIDGKTLYFTRKNAETGEDIYISKKVNGVWQAAEPIAKKINTRTHEVPLSVSMDGETLIIYGNYAKLPQFFHLAQAEPKLGKGDIYFSERSGNQWGDIRVFRFPINTPHYETGLSLSSDKKAVFFTSDRPDVVGGHNPNYPKRNLYYHGSGEFNLDIYVSVKAKKGWEEPINLGEVINTPFAEKNPYLHPDNRTLYFSSDGHYGLGGYDIYVTRRLNPDSWTEWSEPVNLGKTINSPYDDTFYLTATGQQALMVSSKEGNSFGERDIYEVVVPKEMQPDPITVVSGKILESSSESGLETNVIWLDKETDEILGSVLTDKTDGSFSIPLKHGKEYRYYSTAPSHFGNSLTINLKNATEGRVVEGETVYMSSIDRTNKKRKPIILKSLHFDTDSDVIRPESFYDLDRLANLLKQAPQLFIKIEGHTDSDGDATANLDLSERRSQSVLKYLTEKGVGQKIKSAKGFGETRPRVDNETPEGKQLNRRVEFIVLDDGR